MIKLLTNFGTSPGQRALISAIRPATWAHSHPLISIRAFSSSGKNETDSKKKTVSGRQQPDVQIEIEQDKE